MPVIIHPYISTLIVADGIFRFGPPDPTEATFTLSFLVDSLTTSLFRVKTANRGPDQKADFDNFKFSDNALKTYDVIWLFGYDGANFGGSNTGESIGDDELAAIASFMNAGGGVFAAGDHDGLGSVMCGRIPRVGTMRKWYTQLNPPAGQPPNAPGLGPGRIDTTRPDNLGQFWFDNQSDDIPQSFTLLEPHPVFQTTSALISRFPDHMHEGEVTTPADTNQTPTFSGKSFIEYPALNGVQEVPRIIATGVTLPGHTTPLEGQDSDQFTGDPSDTAGGSFNAICIYDGSKVKIGRVLTQSSFHHFLDLNLTGDALGVGSKKLGFTTPTGQPILNDLRTYFQNVGYWLAEHRHWYVKLIYYVIQLPWWVKLFNPGGPVESDPDPILRYGALMREALARYMRDSLTVEFVRSSLADHGLATLLPSDVWRARRLEPGRVIAYGRIVEAALGGAAMAMMAAQARQTLRMEDPALLQEISGQGMATGLRGFAHILQSEAQLKAELSNRLLKGFPTPSK